MMLPLDAVVLAKVLVVLLGAENHEGRCRHQERAKRAAPALLAAAAKYDLDPLLIGSVAVHESDLKPRAVGAAGEIGLMQIKPGIDVMRICGKGLRAKDLFNPRINARVGACWLAEGRRRCGTDPKDFLSWYNGRGCGPSKYSRKVLALTERTGMTVHILRERNFKLYVVSGTLMASRPTMRREWFETELRSTPVNGESFVGRKLAAVSSGEWILEGRNLRLRALDWQRPSHVDEIQLPRPVTNRKGDVVWQDGCWRVALHTRNEVQFLEAPDLLDIVRM